MPTPDKLKEAFEAWHRAVDQHVDMMRGITAGQLFDAEAMTQQTGEIDSLHATWVEMVMRRDEKAA